MDMFAALNSTEDSVEVDLNGKAAVSDRMYLRVRHNGEVLLVTNRGETTHVIERSVDGKARFREVE